MKKHVPTLVAAAAELLAHIEPDHPRREIPTVTTAAASLARLLDSEQYNGKATLSLLEAAAAASSRAVDVYAATGASFQAVISELSKQGSYGAFIKR